MKKPKLVRVEFGGEYKDEFWQHDGHYVVRTYGTAYGGKWRYEESRRYDGKVPRKARKKKPAKVKPLPKGWDSAINEQAIKRRMIGRGYISGPDGALADENIGTRGRK